MNLTEIGGGISESIEVGGGVINGIEYLRIKFSKQIKIPNKNYSSSDISREYESSLKQLQYDIIKMGSGAYRQKCPLCMIKPL